MSKVNRKTLLDLTQKTNMEGRMEERVLGEDGKGAASGLTASPLTSGTAAILPAAGAGDTSSPSLSKQVQAL